MKVIYSKKPILEVEIDGEKYEVVPDYGFDPLLYGTSAAFSAKTIDDNKTFILHMNSFKYTEKYYETSISYDMVKEKCNVNDDMFDAFMQFIKDQGAEVVEQKRPMDFIMEARVIEGEKQ